MKIVPLGIADDDDVAGGIVPELKVDQVSNGIDGGVSAPVHVMHGHAVVAALHDLHIGVQGRVVEGGGKLADAAARLLHHLARLVGAGVLPAVGTGALAQGIVGGEYVAGLQDGAVDLFRAEADVIFTIVGAAGKAGGVGAAQYVFALQHILGDGGLQLVQGDGDRFPGEGIGVLDGLHQCGSVDPVAVDLIRIDDLIIFHADGGIHGRLIQQTGQIVHEPGHGIRVVLRRGSHLLPCSDLVHLGHEGLIGNGPVPQKGKSSIDGSFHVEFQPDTDGLLLRGVGLLVLLLLLGCLCGLHLRIDGVVVFLLFKGCGEGLDAFSGSGVHVRPVREQQVHHKGLLL